MKRSSRDKIWNAILLIPTLFLVMLSFIFLNLGLAVFAFFWFIIVMFIWWSETTTFKYKFRCPNCEWETTMTLECPRIIVSK